jgi:DNA modification methylase
MPRSHDKQGKQDKQGEPIADAAGRAGLTIVYRTVDSLTAYDRNPREHSEHQIEQIAASIREFGWTSPILIDGHGGIIAGHGRALAAGKAGLVEVPCIVLDHLTPTQRRALVIADNRLAEVGSSWNIELLSLELTQLQTDGFDFGLTGFTPEDLATMLAPPPAPRAIVLGNLSDRFGVPPFSVLNAREGWWQARKRAWLALGIRSELGRGSDNLQMLHPETTGTIDFYARKRALEAEVGRELSKAEAVALLQAHGETIVNPRADNKARIDAAAIASQDKLNGLMASRGAAAGPPLPGHPDGRNSAWLRRTDDGGYHATKKAAPVPGGAGKNSVWLHTTPEGGHEPTLQDAAPHALGSGTSIFDPVLCELALRWFCPPGGLVLDPFAGGSVRGIVAARLGRRYHGIDLSAAQIAANREQWTAIRAGRRPTAHDAPVTAAEGLTPIQSAGDILLKRDDLFAIPGAPPDAPRGGKVRTCLALAARAVEAGQKGIVTAGSRSSPQINITAAVGSALGLSVRAHAPSGALGPELTAARERGAEIVQHRPGYNSVIVARARADAAERGWAEIPFGMECDEAVTQTRRQAANVPDGVSRIVMPVGSGMSAAGVLWGLIDAGRLDVPVVGVVVGADPTARLDRYAPPDWRDRLMLISSGSDYDAPATETALGHVDLDAHYEAKCLPFLRPGDLLWIVGIRATAVASDRGAQAAPTPVEHDEHAVRWRMGHKTLSARHDCTLAGITARCHGACCKGTTYWPSRSYGAVCGNLGPAGCVLADADKPVTCLLYPLVAHPENGNIVLHHRTRLPTSCCAGNYGQGPRLVDAIAGQLTALFGPDQYARILADVDAGRDTYAVPSDDLRAAIEAEHREAEANVHPVPRSERPHAVAPPQDRYPDPVWHVGDARDLDENILDPDIQADFIWTCPPYGDLEVYSDDPRDLSVIDHAAFLAALRDIIAAAARRLKPDRFAAIVIGDIRDRAGIYRDLPGHIIQACAEAGLALYNEAILLTAIGSLPVRVARHFNAARKLGRTHQSVLVFVKGDPRAATEACGPCDFGDPAAVDPGLPDGAEPAAIEAYSEDAVAGSPAVAAEYPPPIGNA